MTESSTTASALADALRADVAGLPAGARLPSSRELVAAHRVSPVTVSRALAALTAEGLVVTRPGAGTFKAPPAPPTAPVDHGWQTAALADREIDLRGLSTPETIDEGVVPLSTGYLHPTLTPNRALAIAAGRAARLPDVWEPPPPNGLSSLRTWFAREIGGWVDARDVTVASGGQAAMNMTLRALVAPGDPLLVESPTYPGAIIAARAAGIRPVPVPTDAHGVIPELLADAFARTRARAVFLQPTSQNPTAITLAPQRRAEVLAAAREAGAFVVEDDWARWLAHRPSGSPGGARLSPPLLHDDDEGRVVYLCSLTKSTSANLRIGAVIARGPVAERLRALRISDELFVSRLLQETALEFVSRPAWARHLATVQERLAARAAAFVAGIAVHLPAVSIVARPRAGLHVWVRLPGRLDDLEVTAAAWGHGVTVLPGRPFFCAEPPAPHLRLTFSSARHEADLDTGLRRLAAAVPALSRGS